jgi:hypothetical protein
LKVGSKTLRPNSQGPVSTTSQRTIQLSSSNSRSLMVPISPSVAANPKPSIEDAFHNIACSCCG